MTKDEVWTTLMGKNPRLNSTTPFMFNHDSLRRMFDTAWDQATKEAESKQQTGRGGDDFGKFFGTMFGGKL